MLENNSINNYHESHDKSDLWKKLLEYSISPTDKDSNNKMYTYYDINKLTELLESKETELEQKKKVA